MTGPFEDWLIGRGLVSQTAKEYVSALKNNVSAWASEAGIIERNLLDIDDGERVELIIEKVSSLDVYQEKNTSSHGRFSSALSKYLEYRKSFADSPLERDLREIDDDESTSDTEKRQLVKARLGQGKFRDGVFSIWKRCPITAVQNPELLIASHIKPWAKSDNLERLDPHNGLLLTPNLDRAFDRGLISFSPGGLIMISSQFSEFHHLGIHPELRIKLERRHLPFLEFHQQSVFRRD